MASRKKSYPSPSPFNRRSISFSASSGSNRIAFGWAKGERAALKRIPFKPGENGDEQIARYWENLIKLHDDNLVQYRSFTLEDDGRYLAMEICIGSMLDFCRGTLDSAVTSLVKGIDVMWQITCAVDYLYRQKIGHGDLKLANVLFKKIDLEPHRVVAKLSGYGYNYLESGDNVKTDFSKLGCLYFSAATKKEIRPSGTLATWNLTEIDFNAQKLALDLINLVTHATNPFTFGAGTLLRHPLFIRYCPLGLQRLINEQTNEDIRRGLSNPRNLKKFKKCFGNGQPHFENFNHLEKIIVVDDDKVAGTWLTKAFTCTPQLLAQYIWYVSTTSAAIPNGIDQGPILEIGKSLGKGNYGKVYECNYTNKDGRLLAAACKKCKIKAGAESVFEREIQTLSQLMHLFVIKYLNVVKLDNIKYMVIELCEGSLEQYVEGSLKNVRKNSLDDKIIISQVALGLAYIHSKGIIHKDLKLENILLKRQSHPDECLLVLAKIADFGFAKELKPDSSSFSFTDHPGTRYYMAPELLAAPPNRYPATFASDIYAFGITIARIVLKGNHPFTSDKNIRLTSMVQGLVPPNLHDLSWDLIDLIIKLTDKEPSKRPIMPLVLYHPYFTLTNDKTQKHFGEHLWAHINSMENKQNTIKQMFNSHNFQEWYRTIMTETQETVEEATEKKKTLDMFKKFQPKSTIESLYGPAKQYKQKTIHALNREYDDNIGNQIDQIFSNHALFARDSQSDPENGANSENQNNQQANSTLFLQHQLYRNRLLRVIQSKPVLLISYFWSRLADMINNKPRDTSDTATNHQSTPTGEKKHQLAQLKHWVTNELQWSSLYYSDNEQIADKLWKTKYPETYQISEEKKIKIIRTVAKCNMSPAVLSEILNWIGTNANPVLLHEIVQSHVPNAPKIVEMILQKHWFREENFSSVHLAAFNEGNYADEIMKTLLDSNRIPTVTADGLTSAHIAALNESNHGPTLLKRLLDKGANPNDSFQDGTTPVHWAATNQGKYAAEILKCLLDHGGDSEKIAKNGLKPIHYAMMNTGDSALKLLDLLLKKRGANVVDNTGRTLLHFAMVTEGECGQATLKKLIESGENPSVGDNRKRTPLHLAARNEKIEQLEFMRIILQNGGDPNAVDQLGFTPIHYAAANKGEHAHEKLKLLLLCKGDSTIKDKDGLTPIHYTIINKGKCGPEMRKLVGVNPEKTNAHLNSNGGTILHHLVSKNDGQLELVQMVIDNGGNPNATDKLGRSPVHSVIMLNQSLAGLEMLRLLLEKGGNANLQDKENKFTPVHCVASSLKERAPEKMEILLSSGGNVNAKGNGGITPLHLAVANSGIYGPQLIKTLLRFKANVNATDLQEQTPLHKAISNENDDISFDAILQLVEKGANPNARDIKGLTPIHYAVRHTRRNSVKIVKLLLQHGGSMNIEDNTGMTPQRLAEYCLPECLTWNENLNNEE